MYKISDSALQMFKHYEVGDALIDTEHMKMFELIYLGRTATHTAELILIMRELLDVWNKHQQHETELMERIKYPYIKAHIDQHKALTRIFQQRFNSLVIRNEKITSKYLNPMRDVLDDLLDHIDHYDMGIKEFVPG